MIRMQTFRGADAEPMEYSDLTDTACSLIPACAVARGLSTAGGEVVDESLQKVQATAAQVSAPILAQLARLESTITWAAVGGIAALTVASITTIWTSLRRK